ncbi:large ribosomal subunit protein bL35m [Mixophyes fleayi]|uniref:large ribosomal subunit protein bL35m n=1 Tax=Mixophyes fleayi TaxID=3061075 RepID=UPI003F4E0FDE
MLGIRAASPLRVVQSKSSVSSNMALSCAALRGAGPGSLLRQWLTKLPQSGVSVSGLCRPVLNPLTSHVRNVSGLCSPLCRSTQRLLPVTSSLARTQSASILNRITPLLPSILLQPSRTLTYTSLRKGKRKSVKSVVKRFMRLHCGLWIRRKSGYKKKLWKKTARRKNRLREIVFCNKTQSKLLNKMTTSFWKRRNWYVDDPYQKYHDRTNLTV